MNKRVWVTLTLIVSAGLVGAGVWLQEQLSLSIDEHQQHIRVGLYQNSPKIYRQPDGQPAGLFVDLLNAIAQSAGWRQVYRDCAWDECLQLLENHDIDLMPDVARSPVREQRFDFHQIAVTHSWSGIWSRPDLSILDAEDLQGRRIAILRGAVQKAALDRMMRGLGLDYQAVDVDSLEAGFAAVRAGRADAVVTNKHYADMHGPNSALRETPIVFNPASLYFATAKGRHPDLLQQIDDHLLRWRRDPDSPYFSALKQAMIPPQLPAFPAYLAWILGLSITALGLLLTISTLLRWQVQRSTTALRRSTQRLDHLMSASPVVLYQLSLSGNTASAIWVSENIERLFGYEPAQMFDPGSWNRILHPDERDSVRVNFDELRQKGQLVREYRILDADGQTRHIRDEMRYLPGPLGQSGEIVGSWSDLTQSRKQEHELKFLAHFDALTQLSNRVLLQERLAEALQRARKFSSPLAVFNIDLDRFKQINESFGFGIGDELLLKAAEHLKHELGADDILARVGGDEFVLVVQNEISEQRASHIARSILKRFSVPLMAGDQELILTASIGISLYPGDGQDSESLLKHAELARYAAKHEGRNRFQFFSSELSEGIRDTLAMENGLHGAVQRGELVLHYQPQLKLADDSLVGVEALLRWQHPGFGLVQPDHFIPLAEETGLIGDIGAWALGEACRQLAAWDAQGFHVPHVAVNLAVQQIESGLLIRQIREALASSGLEAERLELELTESTIMREPERATSDLGELHAMGIKLAVDDFGTGYSSLSYLKRLPLDRLKIDQSFVRDIGQDPGDEAIIRAVIQMARSLGLETVAEGVEQPEQAEFLRREGCTLAQGYLYGPAMPAEVLRKAWAKPAPDAGPDSELAS